MESSNGEIGKPQGREVGDKTQEIESLSRRWDHIRSAAKEKVRTFSGDPHKLAGGLLEQYGVFFQDVWQKGEGVLPQSLRSEYARDQAESIISKMKIESPEKKQKISDLMQEDILLDDSDMPFKELIAKKSEISDGLDALGAGGVGIARELANASQYSSRDFEVIVGLIQDTAVADMLPLFKNLHDKPMSSADRDNFVSKIAPPIEGESRNGFILKVAQRLSFNSDNSYLSHSMPMWLTTRQSDVARRIFGEDTISQEDDRIYQTILESTFSGFGGDDHKLLAHYPRPESIRNLVILARDGYIPVDTRGDDARSILLSFKKRNDWEEIKAKAQEKFPELEEFWPLNDENLKDLEAGALIRPVSLKLIESALKDEATPNTIRGFLTSQKKHIEKLGKYFEK